MGSSSKTKNSASPRRLLSSGERVPPTESANAAGSSPTQSIGAATDLIPLDHIDRAVHRHAKVGDAVALKDDDVAINALWDSKRLGTVRRSHLARVRASKANAARIARTRSNPIAVWITLG